MRIDDPQERAKHRIRQLVWLYFWLLIVEGALRKWMLPQLSNPLLVIRDPVAVAIYFYAIRARVFPRNWWMIALGVLAALTILCSYVQLFPYVSPKAITLVAGYGFHANYLHIPMIFIIGSVLRPEDVRRFGWWTLILLIPMVVLMVAQFRAAPDALLNRTAGGEGEMMTAAMGKVRTAGPFSFVVGVMSFFALATAYLIWGVLKPGVYKNWLLAAAGIALLIGIVVSGSRSVVGACVLVIGSLVLVALFRPSALNRFSQVLVVVVILGFVVSRTPIFREGLEVITTRFNEAAEASETSVTASMLWRVWDGFVQPFRVLDKAPLLGFGLGIGTNAGAKLLTGQAVFLLTEDEWARIFLENGPILGLGYVLWRCLFALHVGWLCLRSIFVRSLLPLLLFSSTFFSMLTGQFGQPTILGFTVLVTGLTLAALKMVEPQSKQGQAPLRAKPPPVRRGRSAYAERLHGPTLTQTNGSADQ
jgi:hypothetical protein